MRIEDLLKEKKIKVTKQREQIIDVLMRNSQPLSLGEIEQKCSSVNFSSVFRNIKLLTDKGIVKEHYFGDRKPKYDLVAENSHNHFIKCVDCGKIEELKNICVLEDVNSRTSYQITDHYMEFMGVCPDCTS